MSDERDKAATLPRYAAPVNAYPRPAERLEDRAGYPWPDRAAAHRIITGARS